MLKVKKQNLKSLFKTEMKITQRKSVKYSKSTNFYL